MTNAATSAVGDSVSTTTVIFDYGGVLSSPLEPALRRLEVRFGFPPLSLDELLFGGQHLDTLQRYESGGDPIDGSGDPNNPLHGTWHALERGEIEFHTFLEVMSARAPSVVGRQLTPTDVIVFLSEMEIGTHWTLVHFIRELRSRGFRIGLLTNNVAAFGDHWKATIPLDELFDSVVDSSDVGLRKPDPAIYYLMCEQLGADPRECVFIDDNRDNVAAADSLGMRTVRMRLDPIEAELTMRTMLDL